MHKTWRSKFTKIFLCILGFLLHSNAHASDEIYLNGESIFYKGGESTFCKDYEVIVILEGKRIQEKNSKSPPKIVTNDDISSTFRIMGLAERVGGEKMSKILEKCIGK